MAWIELHDTFPDSPKVKRLARKLGVRHAEACGLLACLWSWSIRHCPDGWLSSLDDEEIELAANWEGEPGKLIDALRFVGFIDETDSGRELHDWLDFAGSYHAAQRQKRSRDRKIARPKSPSRDGHVTVTPDQPLKTNLNRPTKEEEGRSQIESVEPELERGAPDGAPSVTPVEVASLWNEIAPPVGLSKVEKLTKQRKVHVAARLREDPERAEEAWWRRYFGRISSTPFCLGANGRGWKATFDFAVRSEDSIAKILEGAYDGGPRAPPPRRMSDGERLAAMADELERRHHERERAAAVRFDGGADPPSLFALEAEFKPTRPEVS